MRLQVTFPGHAPIQCTYPVESIPFLIQNACLVVPIDRDSREYAKYREVIGSVKRDSSPSHDALYNGRLEHYVHGATESERS